MIIVHGYVTLFNTFAEFIGAIVCLAHGLLDLDLHHTLLGASTIFLGILLKALFLYQHTNQLEDDAVLDLASYLLGGIYLLATLGSGLAFHRILVSIEIIPCVTRFVTCVLPLVALVDSLAAEGGKIGGEMSYLVDGVVVLVLWWFCGNVSLKYFVVVPTVVGLIFSFVLYLIREVQKVAVKESGVDLYGK